MIAPLCDPTEIFDKEPIDPMRRQDKSAAVAIAARRQHALRTNLLLGSGLLLASALLLLLISP
jgi:hypothetical protein